MSNKDSLFIIKRSGELVNYDESRIKNSIVKAMIATGITQTDEQVIANIVEVVGKEIDDRFESDFIPNVENVQDIVEKNLMRFQLFDVAKSYILYRANRQKEREEQRKKKSFLKKMVVKKRNGNLVLFNYKKILNSVKRACDGLEDVSADLVFDETVKNIYDKASTDEIDKGAILAASSLIEKEPNYSKVAARLYLQKLRKEVIGESITYDNLVSQYKIAFTNGIQTGVEKDLLTEKLLEFDLGLLSESLKLDRDDLFEYIGIQTLYERYFIKDKNRRIELPQCFWMRVAMGLCLNEDDKNKRAIELYELFSSMRLVHSTPTLFHSGTECPQLSSCYLNSSTDDLKDIFKTFSDNAQLSKWSGGIGTDWTNVRATGSWIKSTKVESQGVIPFLKIMNDVTGAINRSGKRRGAAVAYLETWHLDIEDFLDLRKNTGDERRRTHDMNTANWVPDLFMKRVKANKEWTLFSPDEVPDLHDLYGKKFEKRYEEYEKKSKKGHIRKFKTLPAMQLWKKMITALFETGHPWITWKDPCNIRSSQDHVGVVHNSNLCVEIIENTSTDECAVCNLAQINLAKHFKNNKLDKKMLAETVEYAIRALDNVIDINYYPIPEAKNSNFRHRPVGLGIMGLQDALFIQNLSFDSVEAVEFSDRVTEIISYHAILASSKLAKEKGTYESYKGSKWDRGFLPFDTINLLEEERGEPIVKVGEPKLDWMPVREHIKQFGMRNSLCMACAPTATISTIAGCYPTIEPIYSNVYVKSNASGEFVVVNHYLVNDLKKLGLWNQHTLDQLKYYDGNVSKIQEIPDKIKRKYKEAFEIDYIWYIKHAAARSKYIDQSQSLNFFVKGASGKLLSELYFSAFDHGLKTTYYLRSLGASQIEKSTLDASKYGFTQFRDSQLPTPAVKACRIDDPTCESCQ